MKKNFFTTAIVSLTTLSLLLSGCSSSSDVQDDTSDDTAMAFPVECYDADSAYTIEGALAEQMVPLAGDPKSSILQAPSAPGTVVYKDTGNKGVVVDASNTADGYIMVKYTGEGKIKVLLTGPSGVVYSYNLNAAGNYDTFVLSDGDGKYNVGVYKQVQGTQYAALLSKDFDVKLKDQFAPFLRTNQYVSFNANSQVVTLAASLTKDCTSDVKKVEAIYEYVIKNITYDKQKAQTVVSGYLPVVDTVIKEKKGICFDYAAVMAAMLRSQGIPTKLVTGYTGSAYHAWISTYTDETGWVEGIIFFDGTTWRMMDPTFAASAGSSEEIQKYIGDGKNYKQKFLY